MLTIYKIPYSHYNLHTSITNPLATSYNKLGFVIVHAWCYLKLQYISTVAEKDTAAVTHLNAAAMAVAIAAAIVRSIAATIGNAYS